MTDNIMVLNPIGSITPNGMEKSFKAINTRAHQVQYHCGTFVCTKHTHGIRLDHNHLCAAR